MRTPPSTTVSSSSNAAASPSSTSDSVSPCVSSTLMGADRPTRLKPETLRVSRRSSAEAASATAFAADKRETRPVTPFTTISLSAPVKLELVQGDSESLSLEGEESALAEIETVVEDGTLKIRTKPKMTFSWSNSKIRAKVSARSIEALKISGSGDIAAAALRAGALKLSISGSGDIRIATLSATNLDVSVSGSGDVTLGGKAESINSSIAGSGDLRAAKLEVREAKVSVAGSGDVTVWATQSLAVRVAGSGDVKYYGDPAIQKNVAGSGSVRRMGNSPS